MQMPDPSDPQQYACTDRVCTQSVRDLHTDFPPLKERAHG
jgi:hypothetical protein